MNTHVLVLQATYTHVEYGLYKNKILVFKKNLIKNSVCTELMFELCHMLKEADLLWKDISHIIVNQGPAPFTTLRALIATVNGIAFAQKIPLIPVDGLEAFTYEIGKKHSQFLIVLNAFAGDFYYSLYTNTTQMGCAPLLGLQKIIQNTSGSEPLVLIGNGVTLLPSELLDSPTICIGKQSEYVSLETIADLGFEKISGSLNPIFSITPLYLKALSYKPSCNV